MIDENKLKEILLRIGESLEATKEGLEQHEHNSRGMAISTTVVYEKDCGHIYEEVYDSDVEDIFKEKKIEK